MLGPVLTDLPANYLRSNWIPRRTAWQGLFTSEWQPLSAFSLFLIYQEKFRSLLKLDCDSSVTSICEIILGSSFNSTFGRKSRNWNSQKEHWRRQFLFLPQTFRTFFTLWQFLGSLEGLTGLGGLGPMLVWWMHNLLFSPFIAFLLFCN